jgi:hypothetical protein
MTSIPVAQEPQPGPQAGPLKVNQLLSSIYWVEEGIGNCGFIIGEKGVIVIDTTVSPGKRAGTPDQDC